MIVGVSCDTPAENRAFREKFDFPYDLLCDEDRTVSMIYGAAESADQGYPARISYQLQRRVERAPDFAQEIAWKAQVRLCKRYRRLVARGKHPNQVTIAIAREMAAFLWDIARQVPVEI